LVVTATVGAAQKAAAGTVARQAEALDTAGEYQSATRPPVPGRPLRVHASQNYPSAPQQHAAQNAIIQTRGAGWLRRGMYSFCLAFSWWYI